MQTVFPSSIFQLAVTLLATESDSAPTLAAPASAPATRLTETERPVVLAARGLRKAFGGQVVLDGIDLELRQGEVILLRGDNGSGKTTLINILTGNLEPDAGTIHYLADGSTREFRFPRRWWQELNPFDHFTPESTAREGIGRMWQDVRLFHSLSLRDNITVAEPGHPGENPIRALFAPGRCRQQEAEIARKADAMLSRLGLAGRETSSADKISLGQSKRVAIARAVAAGARILFLDEPLAGLDSAGIRDVLALLESIARDHGVTLVFVEHVFNHPHLHGLVSTEWHLQSGNLRTSGIELKASLVCSNELTHRPAWLRHLISAADTVTDQALPNGATLTCIHRPTAAGQKTPSPILKVVSMTVNRGTRVVIGRESGTLDTGLSFTLLEGDICILQAPNGWGKSTLLDSLSGMIPSKSRELCLGGRSIANKKPWEIRRRGLNYLPSSSRLFPSFSIQELDNLLGVPQPRKSLSSKENKRLGHLSGGQMQKLKFSAITRSSWPTRLLCLDEPFNALDESTCEILAKKLIQMPRDCILIAVPTASSAD